MEKMHPMGVESGTGAWGNCSWGTAEEEVDGGRGLGQTGPAKLRRPTPCVLTCVEVCVGGHEEQVGLPGVLGAHGPVGQQAVVKHLLRHVQIVVLQVPGVAQGCSSVAQGCNLCRVGCAEGAGAQQGVSPPPIQSSSCCRCPGCKRSACRRCHRDSRLSAAPAA